MPDARRGSPKRQFESVSLAARFAGAQIAGAMPGTPPSSEASLSRLNYPTLAKRGQLWPHRSAGRNPREPAGHGHRSDRFARVDTFPGAIGLLLSLGGVRGMAPAISLRQPGGTQTLLECAWGLAAPGVRHWVAACWLLEFATCCMDDESACIWRLDRVSSRPPVALFALSAAGLSWVAGCARPAGEPRFRIMTHRLLAHG